MRNITVVLMLTLAFSGMAHAKNKGTSGQRLICDESPEVSVRIDCLNKMIGDLKIKTEIILLASETDDTEIAIDTLTPAELLAYEKALRESLNDQYKMQAAMDPTGLMASMIMSVTIFKDQLLKK
ncbi:MAG: hypothetical protein IT286_01380 [Proteobacteria bacterium]|jgi:hypothetical protein|nr:hypothetical protein [Pseudomonadota bacterium]